MKTNTYRTGLLALSLTFGMGSSCVSASVAVPSGEQLAAGTVQPAPAPAKWSERMLQSVLKRSPWMADASQKDTWGYTQGLIIYALEQVWRQTKDPQYLAYIQRYGDKMIDAQGQIKTYKPEDFNLDNLNSGKVLFNLYAQTKDEKYRKALDQLREQLRKQPRTSEGGYWHKLKYPQQMWLDGAYMASPFLAQYAATFNEPAAFDEVANQLILLEKHLRDPQTGLLYHGYDESRQQIWANKTTGASPNVWGRAMGWYGMALVDVLDYFPAKHPQRKELLQILDRLAVAVVKYQDPKSGLWYQVVDQPAKAGNYLEASASSMFVYALAKGTNRGYLPKTYRSAAEKGYAGITRQLVEVKPDGEVNLLQVCEVAGLSADRDGSYEYYIKEPIRVNDPKGTGPFILASLELNQ
ncbi:glycoside hydrolase family 88 protein [Hymenobacter cellulosivorans]|uniref:Glycoside hydrolase family 88 protein n=1 Tax=Hymenobacter cellulosivorans TaxID=2932249 RepID=A0ABY4F9I1_9BACT|nr:glycoside hydrolase family 88 protein [Hymenobacter cellulosivorans]UOQ51116.1 glycoside hydrolase family 88 protein [Hymenobacter cellulosivorans]